MDSKGDPILPVNTEAWSVPFDMFGNFIIDTKNQGAHFFVCHPHCSFA